MPRKVCRRHGTEHPCTCAMGNLYRFVEPVVLLLLKEHGPTHGYELAVRLREQALTDAEVERGALYRTLRQLEANGNVGSEWTTATTGPARRVYRLTSAGEHHLEEWATVLEHMSAAMRRFVRDARASRRHEPRTPRTRTAVRRSPST